MRRDIFMFVILGLCVGAIILTSLASAGLNWEKSCTNSTHLYKEIRFDIDSEEFVINQSIECDFGCEDDLDKYGAGCKPTSMDQGLGFLWIVIILLGILFVIWWLK